MDSFKSSEDREMASVKYSARFWPWDEGEYPTKFTVDGMEARYTGSTVLRNMFDVFLDSKCTPPYCYICNSLWTPEQAADFQQETLEEFGAEYDPTIRF